MEIIVPRFSTINVKTKENFNSIAKTANFCNLRISIMRKMLYKEIKNTTDFKFLDQKLIN